MKTYFLTRARRNIIFLFSFLVLAKIPSSSWKTFQPDYSNPKKTLQTFFQAGHRGAMGIAAKCFFDLGSITVKSLGYKNFIEQVQVETRNPDFRLFKVEKKGDLLELGIEIISSKPYFCRRDFYYLDYFKGKWLIVSSGWIENFGCG